MWIWLIGAALVAAALAYVVWEFRWYLTTLIDDWRADESAESAEPKPDRELARRH